MLSSPLRDLTKQDVVYSWGSEHDRAFNKVKNEVSSLGVLRYFDLDAETTVQTDASLKGLGAVLLQDGQPVCYASKALTEAEQRYSNIEREALGVVWRLERFHYFIYAKNCTVHTDHKPLEAIFKKLSSCLARQQKQELLQPEPLCYPWQILNSDLFEHKGNQYLLLSDEYSKFPIIRKLTSTTSRAIINHFKSIFAEYGIPDKLNN